MALTDSTANTVLLYSVLTKESFGTTASRIVELLGARESCTLAEIVSRLSLRTRAAVRELQLLVRHQLVTVEGGSTVVFRAHTENLERLIRYAHFDRLIEAMLRSRNASRVVRCLFVFGTLRLFDILVRCFDELERRDERLAAGESEASNNKSEREREAANERVDVVRQLAALCQCGIVRARPIAEVNSSSLPGSASVSVSVSARVGVQNDAVRRLLSGAPNNFSALAREAENVRRSRSASASAGGRASQTAGDWFLELDFGMLDRLVIDDLCGEAIQSRFGEFSAELVRAMLAESRRRIAEPKPVATSTASTSTCQTSREIDTNYPLETVWMRVDEFAGARGRLENESIVPSRVDWSTVSDEVKRSHLDAIVTDSAGFVESDGLCVQSNSQTRYAVRVQKIVERLAEHAVERVIEQRDGARAARVFRCVRTLEYADLKELESGCLLSAKEAKELTFKLLADHFIRLTELSRSGNFVSSQSLFLLRVEPLAVVRRIVELVSRTLHNLIAKRLLIIEENLGLFEAERRIETELTVLQREYRDALLKIRERAATGGAAEGDADDEGEANGDEASMTVDELDAIQTERNAEIRARLCDADRARLESAKRAVAMLRNAELRIGEQLFLLETHTLMSVAAQRIAQRSARATGTARRRVAITAGADIVQQLAAASTSAAGSKRRTTATKHDDDSAGVSDGKRRRKV